MTIALLSQPVHGQQASFNQRMTRVFMEGLALPAVKPVRRRASKGEVAAS